VTDLRTLADELALTEAGRIEYCRLKTAAIEAQWNNAV
jgi:hypothetical protein